jgi:cellulose synthase/poly-beta-1,6-N-acetylglucosamine synthase-like glycosyltransferase
VFWHTRIELTMEKPSRTITADYIQQFSELAGPLHSKSDGMQDGAMKFTRHIIDDRLIYRIWTRCVAYGSLLLVIILTVFLFQPSHWVVLKPDALFQKIIDSIMLICLATLQIFLLLGTYMSTRSTLRAKNPVPMVPPKGLRVALATTRAPGEPIKLVKQTLLAARKVHYEQGTVDVWLLDETRSKSLERLCEELGVYYFSRKNVAAWNILLARRGFFKRVKDADNEEGSRLAAKTKHGNFNAWGRSLEGDRYDIIAGIDTDQIPQPNFLERLLGYFNDPDVAYVVGPQVYANYQHGLQGLVTRWADSQASFFQSTIQRAANASSSAMLVGTNYAVRSQALSQVKGFYPCITEDLATGIAIQSNHNPKTGNHWKSVYTPDVLALGEGPSFWGPYFTQQWRWAAGAFDATHKLFGSIIKNLSAKARVHYLLILLFYPIAALTWLFGVLSSLLYVFTGASAITVSWNQFISLYLMSSVLQLGAYFWNHRGDVSPFTLPGSYGIPGMVITSLTVPIYLSALFGMAFGRSVSFVVTKKGSKANPDWFKTFALQLEWAALLIVGLLFGLAHHHNNAAMLVWLSLQLAVCLVPLALGLPPAIQQRWKSKARVNTQGRLWGLARSSNA